MRHELPNSVPHDLQVRSRVRPEPLEPSPLERHAAPLKDIAAHPRQVKRPEIERPSTHKIPSPSLEIPTDHRVQRNRIPQQAIGLSLRDEEVKLLSVV